MQGLPPTVVVQRYQRTDRDRGQWAPVDSSWKTPANSGLVGHDIYHHLPDDRGTFAQEVATFGAEWYIDVQPINGPFEKARERDIKLLEQNVSDTVLNALDSREPDAFNLPLREAPALSPVETNYFRSLADVALATLDASSDPRARSHTDFRERFVRLVQWGYAIAKARFPDQAAVRKGSKDLRDTLSELDTKEVPYGHEVTLTLDGPVCSVSYTDADAPFLAEAEVVRAYLMPWCSQEHGYPVRNFSLHAAEADYAAFVEEHFASLDADPSHEEFLIPQDEQRGLMQVYVRTPELLNALTRERSIRLPLELLTAADYTPKEVPIL